MLPFPLVQWLSAPLWWIFNKGLFLSPSEELIKVIEARADEPHHPDLEALPSPPPHNYTCIIRTRMHTHTLMYVHTHTHHRDSPKDPRPVYERHSHQSQSQWITTRQQQSYHAPRHYRKGWLHCFVEMIFIFQPDNHSSVLCLCMGFFPCSVFLPVSCFSSLSHLSPLFSASLCVAVSHCLQSDGMASVQNRRRLGIWWCGACKWSLCQGCLF